MSAGISDNTIDTQPLSDMTDFADPLDENFSDYDTFNTSPCRQITPPESDIDVQYNVFDVNQDPPAF